MDKVVDKDVNKTSSDGTTGSTTPDVEVEEEYTEVITEDGAQGGSDDDDEEGESNDDDEDESNDEDGESNDEEHSESDDEGESGSDDDVEGGSNKAADGGSNDDVEGGSNKAADGGSNEEAEGGSKKTNKGYRNWVNVANPQMYSKKLRNQFVEKPMHKKRCKREMKNWMNEHHVAVCPVKPESMTDPAMVEIMQSCNQVHIMYHHICSRNTGQSTLLGFLQLWFKCESDIKRHLPYLRTLGGDKTKIFYSNRVKPKAKKDTFSYFRTTWTRKYKGTFETTMMIPYLPAHITENELWDIFPLSQEIATYEEKTPSFRYAYILFPHEKALNASVESANKRDRCHKLNQLHLLPMQSILAQIDGRQQSSKTNGTPTTDKRSTPTLSPKKMAKKTKVVVSAINKRFQQNKPSMTGMSQHRFRPQSAPARDEPMQVLNNMLSALGPDGPHLLDTIVNTLDEQDPNYGGPNTFFDDNFGSGSMGRGRGQPGGQRKRPGSGPLHMDQQRLDQQWLQKQQQQGNQLWMQKQQQQKQNQLHAQHIQNQQSQQWDHKQQQWDQKQQQQMQQQQKHISKAQANKHQIAQEQAHKKHLAQLENCRKAVQPLMQQDPQGAAYQNMVSASGRGRGRGRGLLRYPDDVSFDNSSMSRQSQLRGGRGRARFNQGWTANQNYSMRQPSSNYEDWDGDYGYQTGDGFPNRGFDFSGSVGGEANYNFGTSEDFQARGRGRTQFGNEPYGGNGYL